MSRRWQWPRPHWSAATTPRSSVSLRRPCCPSRLRSAGCKPCSSAREVGGLVASAILHIGLAPAHFEEATSYGVFFCVAGVALAIAAAAILAWPSRPAYLAGAGLALMLIVLWAVFRLVPPPGVETAEDVDLVGLFTKATELVAIIACAVLWFRDRHVHRQEEDGADEPVTVNEGRA